MSQKSTENFAENYKKLCYISVDDDLKNDNDNQCGTNLRYVFVTEEPVVSVTEEPVDDDLKNDNDNQCTVRRSVKGNSPSSLTPNGAPLSPGCITTGL